MIKKESISEIGMQKANPTINYSTAQVSGVFTISLFPSIQMSVFAIKAETNVVFGVEH